MSELTTSPWQAQVDRISSKTVVGSKLRTAEWAQVPLALREQALFSAGVENTRILSAMKDKLTQAAQQVRTDGLLQNKGRFVADLRNMLGAAPGDSGSLTDLTSRRRLGLIWDHQSASAHAAAARQADLDPDVMDAFPAYRLVRLEDRRVPRDWYARWGTAGAKVGWAGASRTEMVALVTSPIWAALSRFGRPSPPFDFSSGMGLDSVDRDEAEALGLLPKGEPPAERRQRLSESSAQAQQGWNENLSASVKGLSPEAQGWLEKAFNQETEQVRIEDGRAVWISRTVEPMPDQPTIREAWETLTASTPAEVPASLAQPAAVEVAAVGAGTKPVYHEQVGPQLAPTMAGWLKQGAGPAVDVWSSEGHVFARRNYGPERAEIESRLKAGAGGELLGYGAETMLRPGQWRVRIFDAEGRLATGFYAEPATAEMFAEQRLRDWQRATGRQYSYTIIQP